MAATVTPFGARGVICRLLSKLTNQSVSELMVGTLERIDCFPTVNIVTGGQDEQINVRQ